MRLRFGGSGGLTHCYSLSSCRKRLKLLFGKYHPIFYLMAIVCAFLLGHPINLLALMRYALGDLQAVGDLTRSA
jgi:hypothetical protein